jgi:hypothetical protein
MIDRDEDGYQDEPRIDRPTCQNCTRTVDSISMVPEYEYMGCDDCMLEALAVLAEESKAALKIPQDPELCPVRYEIFGRALSLRAMAAELKSHTASCAACTKEAA